MKDVIRVPVFHLSIRNSVCDPDEPFIPFQTLNEASALYRLFIETNGLGSRDAGEAVIYADGKAVARVSYNGKVWDTDGGLNPEPLYEP